MKNIHTLVDRATALFFSASLIALSGCLPDKTDQAVLPKDNVYIGPGERVYHERTCPLAGPNFSEYGREDTVTAGYAPCEVCHFSVPREEVGKVVEKSARYGKYTQYVPANLKTPIRLVVIAHGTPGGTDTTGLGA
ncbi:MAG: hypothetical protein IT365_01785, partial [Candidatus Hydrogenedentes bacterium]|nr:hypothetical protein [Candidatus Hydrogenedentota bacterium]